MVGCRMAFSKKANKALGQSKQANKQTSKCYKHSKTTASEVGLGMSPAAGQMK